MLRTRLHDLVRPATVLIRPYVLGAGPCFELAAPGLSRVFRLAVGWQVFTLDVPGLDARFGRIGDDPVAIRRAFSAPALAALAQLPALRLHSDGMNIELYLPEGRDPFDPEAARALLRELAAVDAAPAHAALRALPGAVFRDQEAPPYAELPALGVRVRFLGEQGRRVTRVSRTGNPSAGTFLVDAHGAPDRRGLPPAVLARLPALGAAVLRGQNGVASVTLAGLVTDAERLLRAATACHAFATGVPDSVYR
jgi:hypothetical protein